MAERLKTKLLETDKMVDLVAGPGMPVAVVSTISISYKVMYNIV